MDNTNTLLGQFMESQYRCIRTLTDKASSLTFSSDGKTLVSFSDQDSFSYKNKTANVWDVNTGELKKTFTGLRSMALSLDGKTLAGSNNDNTIKLFDIETGELKNSLTGHSSEILFIAFSPDGNGFSLQKQIWEGVLRNEPRRMQMNASPLNDLDQFECCVGWGTIDFHSHYHGANDEYFSRAWETTRQGYYPRAVHQHKPLEIFSRLEG